MGAIIGGALALLVAAGVAAWFLMKKDETPQPPAKPAAPAAAPVPAAAACSKENLASAAEMAFVQDCVRDVRTPPPCWASSRRRARRANVRSHSAFTPIGRRLGTCPSPWPMRRSTTRGLQGKRLLQGGRRYSCVLVSGRVGQGQGQRTGAGTPEGSAEMRNIALALGLISLVTAAHAAPPLLQEGKKTLYQRVLTTPGCALHEAPGGKPGAVQPTFSRFYVYAGKDEAGKSWSAGRTGLFWQDAGLARQVVHGGLEDADVPGVHQSRRARSHAVFRTDRPWTRCSTPLTQSKRSRLCASS